MAQVLAGDEKGRDLIHDDDYRSYLVDRTDAPVGYRFARTHGKRTRVGARDGFWKNMITAIVNSKLRRMERELELRGVRYDRPNSDGVKRDPGRAGAGED